MALTYSGKFAELDGHWTKNPMFININTDNLYDTGVRRPNFTIQLSGCTVTFLNTSLVEYIPNLALIPDDDGNVTIDISKLVDSICEKYANTTDLTESFGSIAFPTFGDIDIFINAAESYGNPPTIKDFYYIKRRAHFGAIHNEDESNNWTFVSTITDYADTTPLLTNLAQYSTLRYSQGQYLTYYHNRPIDGTLPISIIFKVILNDGTEGYWQPPGYYPFTNVNPLRRFSFYFSPAIIGLPNNVAILSARIYRQDSDPLTDWINFKIDYEEKDCDKRFVYVNQFGVLETLYSTGRTASNLDLVRNTVNTEVTWGKQALFNGQKQRSVEMNKPYVLRSGYISKAELTAWLDMIASNHVFEEVMMKGERGEIKPSYRAIIFKTDKFKITECGQYLHSFEAEYKYAYPAVTMNEGSQIIDDTSTIPTFTPQETIDSTTYIYLN